MAQATNPSITSRFHNLSNEALADAIGHADALLKGAETECKALKDEFKHRNLLTVAGEQFTVTRSEQISGGCGESSPGRRLAAVRGRHDLHRHSH